MRATTASKDRGNAATPLSEMEHPVLEVLEGIRVQRMSLVQSLRQFVFVHRGQFLFHVELGTMLIYSDHDCLHPTH